MVRYLEFDEALRPEGGSEVVCQLPGPIKSVNKDPAGFYFHLFQLKQAGVISFKAHGKKKDKKDKKKKKDADLYGLLGLKNERWTATENQLKLAYRKVCLEHHPDKKLAGVTDDLEKARIEEYFKGIQEAYNTLSDPAKRREYDSVDEFDDSLPSECASEVFFKVFGPAFRRNARWSTKPKVPELGDETATWKDVEKFYDFWFSFKSWREFPHEDEEDVEGCEGRDHRRYVERFNSKLREKGKKDEVKRLKAFVEDAYRIDPRVVKKRDEEKFERERKKQEKFDARNAVHVEAERKKKEEEESKLATEEMAAKKRAEEKVVREAQKKATKKERQKLRMLCESDGVSRLISDDNCERLCGKLDLEALQALNESICVMGITREAQREILDHAVLDLDDKAGAEERAKERQKKALELTLKNASSVEHQKKLATMSEWNEDELRMLDKAVSKFPVGTPKRWEAVSAYIRTRTLEEVVLMVKERQGMAASRFNKSEDFKAGQKKRAEVTCQADLRQAAFTDVNVNLSGTAASVVHDMVTPEELKAMEGEAPATAPEAASNGTAEKKVTAGSGEWNEEQEQALVNAMKEFGKELTDRWDRVAEVVPGKSKVQCFKRFKELREVFRSKKEEEA
eukprot:gene18069-24493_t